VRVTLDWSTPGRPSAVHAEPNRVELEAAMDAGPRRTWTPSDPRREHWEEALSASSCAEVTLTSHVRRDVAARDLVLELAEYLTQKLAKTQSLIVVRFLPEGSPRA
jgi:hypothetical protein